MPVSLIPVVALIEKTNLVNTFRFYEIVFYNQERLKWEAFEGSNTFKNNEQVLDWFYPQTRNRKLQQDYF